MPHVPERISTDEALRRRASSDADSEREFSEVIEQFLLNFDPEDADPRHRFHVDLKKRRGRTVGSFLATVVASWSAGSSDYDTTNHVLLADDRRVLLHVRLPFDGSTVVELSAEAQILGTSGASRQLATAHDFKTWYPYPGLKNIG